MIVNKLNRFTKINEFPLYHKINFGNDLHSLFKQVGNIESSVGTEELKHFLSSYGLNLPSDFSFTRLMKDLVIINETPFDTGLYEHYSLAGIAEHLAHRYNYKVNRNVLEVGDIRCNDINDTHIVLLVKYSEKLFEEEYVWTREDAEVELHKQAMNVLYEEEKEEWLFD